MKYVEIGATYEVLVPEDWGHDFDTQQELNKYKTFWDGKLFTVEALCGGNIYRGSTPGRGNWSYIPPEWLNRLVKHCPQVEHYINSQQKETYVSIFDAEIK